MKYLNSKKARMVVGLIMLVLLIVAAQGLFSPSVSEGIAIRNPLWGAIYSADVASAVTTTTSIAPSFESP